MNKLIALFFVILLTGCAAPTYKHEVPGLQKSEVVHLTDARPKSESEQKLFSALITSDAYAIYRWGAQVLDPSAMRILQHKVYEKFPNAEAPVDLKVYHFVSYMNAQSSFRRSAIGSIGGAIGAAIASGTQNYDANNQFFLVNREQFEAVTEDNEYTRAYVTERENPNNAPVFVVYLDAEINGRRQLVKSISQATKKNDKDPYLQAVENTINGFMKPYE